VGVGLDADLSLNLGLELGSGFIFVFVLVLNPAGYCEDKNKYHTWAGGAPYMGCWGDP
jgi:hypothetical protein